eukprot:3099512-Pleurochrysis_carterae.AAC.2
MRSIQRPIGQERTLTREQCKRRSTCASSASAEALARAVQAPIGQGRKHASEGDRVFVCGVELSAPVPRGACVLAESAAATAEAGLR